MTKNSVNIEALRIRVPRSAAGGGRAQAEALARTIARGLAQRIDATAECKLRTPDRAVQVARNQGLIDGDRVAEAVHRAMSAKVVRRVD